MKQIEEKKAAQYFFTLKFHAVTSTNTYWGKKDICKIDQDRVSHQYKGQKQT